MFCSCLMYFFAFQSPRSHLFSRSEMDDRTLPVGREILPGHAALSDFRRCLSSHTGLVCCVCICRTYKCIGLGVGLGRGLTYRSAESL
jgi:hypothetical protein